MKILLLGANGQVGWEVNKQAHAKNVDIVAIDRKTLDITKFKEVKKIVQETKPNVLINAAAYTAVDRAESESELAFAVNRDAVKNIAQVCDSANISLIHFSTDYVFDGKKGEPYTEDDEVNPLNVYGLSKWEGEEEIRRYLQSHLIIRTSWVFGKHGNNFVKTIYKLAQTKKELRVIDDQYGCPTFASNIAKVVENIYLSLDSNQTDLFGTYHYCDRPITTWYQFAENIVNQSIEKSLQQECKIISVSSEEYNAIALRPKYSVLGVNKLFANFKLNSEDWRQKITKTLELSIL